MEEVKFYKVNQEYGYLSNFYPSSFISNDNIMWRTVEHYFQAMKTSDPERRKMIWKAPTPIEAAQLGRDKKNTILRSDWESRVNTDEANTIANALSVPFLHTKDMIMLEALIWKFKQNIILAAKLKSTAPRVLIEDTDNDYYWGIGQSVDNVCRGKNMLGKLLMYVRDNVL